MPPGRGSAPPPADCRSPLHVGQTFFVSNPARVLLVEWNVDGTVGGSHQLLYDLVRCLDRERYEPVVLFYQRNRFSDLLREKGVEVVEFDDSAELERRIRMEGGRVERYVDYGAAVVRRMNVIRSHRIDIVHLVNSPLGGADDWLPASRATRIPCIATACGLLPPETSGIQSVLMRGFDRILASSRAVEDQLAVLGVRGNVEVVHLGVDVSAFRSSVARTPEEVRAELEVPPGRILVTMVGNIRPWKGQHVAVDALARLPAVERDRFFLVLVGRTPEESADYAAEVRETIGRTGLDAHVRFLGARLDVADLFNASDLALHASVLPEPFGLVLVEALCVGTPVIAADRGGPLDILTDETGWLFDPEDPAELTGLLAQLANAPGHLARMSGPAREHAEQFSATAMADRVQRVYADVHPNGGG